NGGGGSAHDSGDEDDACKLAFTFNQSLSLGYNTRSRTRQHAKDDSSPPTTNSNGNGNGSGSGNRSKGDHADGTKAKQPSKGARSAIRFGAVKHEASGGALKLPCSCGGRRRKRGRATTKKGWYPVR